MNRYHKIYTGLCVMFCTLIVLGNLTYQKFVSLSVPRVHTFELSVGAILYPLTFLMSDLIAEFYGKERATFCVRFALVMNAMVALILMLMNALPATSWSKIDDATFQHMFGFYSVAFLGSMIACYIAQKVDIFLYLLIKEKTQGKYLWLRNNVSTACSLLVDTCVVITILTVFNVLPSNQWQNLIMNSYSWKLFFTMMSTPLFYFGVQFIKTMLKNNKPEPKMILDSV